VLARGGGKIHNHERAADAGGERVKVDRILHDTFFIGVYPGLTDEMIDFVVSRFASFFARTT